MRGKIRKAACLLACLLAGTFALAGCKDKASTTDGSSANVTAWSASSAEKILRDYEYPEEEKGAAAIYVSLAQNELEGAQLILNTDVNVSSYTVKVSDLKCGEETINSDTISVYHQKYVETKFSSKDYYYTVMNIPSGWFPDALLPYETAVAYRENRLYAGQNQGLWFTFDARGAEPGTYTGTIEIAAGGSTLNVPVTLEVWDFAISTESHSRTLFNIYRDALTDSIGDGSDEMYEKYYEFFLDYRINLQKLPIKADDFQQFISVVKKYHNDPRVNTWAIPTFNHQENKAPSGSTEPEGVSWRAEKQMELIAAIVVESVKDGVNYLEKAVHYPIEYDEFGNKGADAAENAKKGFALFREYTQKLADQFDAIYGEEYLDSVDGLRDSVEWLPQIAVTNYTSLTYEAMQYANIWCPLISNLAPQSETVKNDLFTDDGSEFGEVQKNKELWTYTCNFPQWPYPTYHIDDELFTSRLLSWMMYDYGYTGNLYYLAVMSGDSQSEDSGAYNPWENAESNSISNGDGNLVYPGTYYGIDGPVPTIRLESIRDGMEEYEYFYLLDTLYQQMQDYYKVDSLSYRNVCNDIFASVYQDGHFSNSLTGDAVIAARERVAEAIISVMADEHLIVESERAEGNDYYVSVLLSSDAAVKDHPNLVSTEDAGNGKRYNFKFDISGDKRISLDLSYTIGGQEKTYSKLIKNATHLFAGMNSESDLSKVNVSAGSSKTVAQLEGSSRIFLDIVKLDGDSQPWFNFIMSQFGSFEGEKLQVAIYNGSETSVTVELVYKLSTSDSVPTEIVLSPGWNRIDIDMSEYGVSEVAALAFMLDNRDEGYQFYLGEVKYYEV